MEELEVSYDTSNVHTVFTRIVAQGYYYFFTQKQG